MNSMETACNKCSQIPVVLLSSSESGCSAVQLLTLCCEEAAAQKMRWSWVSKVNTIGIETGSLKGVFDLIWL